jgi:diguanylate cyclase (GGDEF)-like protein
MSVAAVSLLFTAAVTLRWGGRAVTNTVDDLGEAIAAFVAVGGAFLAIRRSTETRRAWTFLGASALSWGIGELVWSWYELVRHRQVPFPSLADVGFLLAVPLAVAGLLAFPAAPRGAVRRARVTLDGAIIATSLLFVSWALVLGPVWHAKGQTVLAQTISLAYPVGDAVIAAIVFIVLSQARRSQRISLSLVGAALLAMAVADSAFAYLTNQSSFGSGNGLDAGWVVGYLLLALAALYAALASATRVPHPKAKGAEERFDSWATVVLPYLPLVAATGVGAFRLAEHDRIGPFLGVAGTVLVTLVCVRQLMALIDNLELGRALERAVGLLEAREEQLSFQAFHDSLTGLANRSLLWDRIEHAIALGGREHRNLAVLYIDLDGFKQVNDMLGHEAGDQLLAAVAERMRAVVRPSETVARVGGDEFAVLVETFEERSPDALARRLLEALATPFATGSHRIVVGASIGIAISAGGASTVDDLMRYADAAMYEAKRTGKGGVSVSHVPANTLRVIAT